MKFEGCEELYNPDFYLHDRENICATCGATKEFARFQTVPHLYRLSFPHAIKTHTSSDIVLLCQHCHDKATKYQDCLKKTLADRFGFPLTEKSHHLQLDSVLGQLHALANIVRNHEHLPPDKLKESMNLLTEVIKREM
jgi:hypothetical protein